MIDEYIGARRSMPLHDPMQSNAEVGNTQQTRDMQAVEPSQSGVRLDAETTIDDYTISVEQVREHLRSRGLKKSKDTVQRWCRSGDLSCQKRGVFNRYFTTEASLKKLEAKLLPDMVADAAGEAKLDVDAPGVVQAHAAPEVTARPGMQLQAPEDEAAHSSTPPEMPVHAAECDELQEEMQLDTTSPVPSMEVVSLREQLKSKDSEIEFLREEIRAARSERSNVVQISNRMMEALETMVIGGKVERLNSVESNPSDRRSL